MLQHKNADKADKYGQKSQQIDFAADNNVEHSIHPQTPNTIFCCNVKKLTFASFKQDFLSQMQS